MKTIKTILSLSLVFLAVLISSFKTPTKTVLIDASHGGKDSGALVEGLSEKEIALELAKALKEESKNYNFDVLLIRNSDEFLSLKDRAIKANSLNATMLISLHLDMNPKDLNSEITLNYCNDMGHKLAEDLSSNLDLDNSIRSGEFYILKNSNCPSVILNAGNLASADFRKKLTNEEHKAKLIKSLCKAINNSL